MQQLHKQRSLVYYINGWVIDIESDQLLKGERTIKLEPKIMSVLVCLIENQGLLVSKDYLLQTVWNDVTITDHPVIRAISQLRKIFADNARNPRIIETTSKKGYRLICPVEKIVNCDLNTFQQKLQPPITQMSAAPQQIALKEKVIILALCLLLLLLVGNFLPTNSLIMTEQLFAGRNAIPLTASLGIEKFPAFSPDEQHIVYSHKDPQTEQWDLYLKEIHGSPKQLTDTPQQEMGARFTYGQDKIAYIQKESDGSSIIAMDLKDQSTTEVMRLYDQRIVSFDWSVPARSIAYAAMNTATYPTALFIQTLENGQKRQITSPGERFYGDRYPAFSPEGKWVAFARMDTKYNDDVFIVSTEDGQLKRLTFDNQIIFGLDWSPVNNNIIYCVYDHGEYHLKSLNTDGKSQFLTTSYIDGQGIFPSVSNSGKFISFEHWTNRKNIYNATVDLANGSISDPGLVVSSSAGDWNGKISPNGKQVVFLSERSGRNELWMSNIDGSDLRRITSMKVPYNCMPSWAPDGSNFVFAHKSGELYTTYRYYPDADSTVLLETDAVVPEYSRDGNSIYFSSMRSGDWRVWKMPASGGDAVQLTRDNGFAAMESVDGRTVYYCKRGEKGIWQLLEGGGEEQVIKDLGIIDTQNWLVVESGIYYVKRPKRLRTHLMFYRFDDQTEIELQHPLLQKHRLDDGLSLSPAGKLHFSLNDLTESDIRMISLIQ